MLGLAIRYSLTDLEKFIEKSTQKKRTTNSDIGKHNNRLVGLWVPLTYDMMDNPAYRELSESSLRVLFHCMRKINRKDVNRFSVIFQLTYPEARKRLALVDATFRRAMKQLHSLGFIDYCNPGGLRNKGRCAKGHQLSLSGNSGELQPLKNGMKVTMRAFEATI